MNETGLDKKNMGLRIRRAREEKGLTREELAEKIGLSVNAMANIELGHSGTQLDNFAKLCKLLGLSADYALFGETTGRPPVQRVMELLGHQDDERLRAIEKAVVAMLEVMK